MATKKGSGAEPEAAAPQPPVAAAEGETRAPEEKAAAGKAGAGAEAKKAARGKQAAAEKKPAPAAAAKKPPARAKAKAEAKVKTGAKAKAKKKAAGRAGKAAAGAAAAGKTIRIRQVRSIVGTQRRHREILRGLGLRRIRHEVERPDTPAVRGTVAKVSYLVEIVEEPR